MLRIIGTLYAICMTSLMIAISIGTRSSDYVLSYVVYHSQLGIGQESPATIDTATGVSFITPLRTQFPTTAIRTMAWSPDGAYHLVGLRTIFDNATFMLQGADDTQIRYLFETTSSFFTMPQWSPNSDALVYYERGENESIAQLQYYDLQTDTLRPIADIPTIGNSRSIAWLPDNEHLVMRANYSQSDSSFARINVGDATALTYLPVQLNPYERMLPMHDGSGFLLLGGWEIAYVANDALDTPQTLHDAHANYTDIALAPDNKNIAFISKLNTGYTGDWVVTLMNLETGTTQNVFRTPTGVQGLDWSSDSQPLLFVNVDAPLFNVYTVHADGTSQRLALEIAYFLSSDVEWRP
ncbi:MAG: hypothetical protein AAFQ52_05410 [Chloroflexota bacterium]